MSLHDDLMASLIDLKATFERLRGDLMELEKKIIHHTYGKQEQQIPKPKMTDFKLPEAPILKKNANPNPVQ